jgi:hypothetical protein
MKRNRAITGVCAGLLTVTALAAPAAAAPEQSDDPENCPDGAVCFWEGPGFEGEMTVREHPGPNCDPVPGGNIGSMVNHLDRPVLLFIDEHCDEPVQIAFPFEPIPDAGYVSSWK